jgi:hypothetical protein
MSAYDSTPEAMAKKAREQFYQPRTQTSREILGAVGEFLQPITNALPPTLGATGYCSATFQQI